MPECRGRLDGAKVVPRSFILGKATVASMSEPTPPLCHANSANGPWIAKRFGRRLNDFIFQPHRANVRVTLFTVFHGSCGSTNIRDDIRAALGGGLLDGAPTTLSGGSRGRFYLYCSLANRQLRSANEGRLSGGLCFWYARARRCASCDCQTSIGPATVGRKIPTMPRSLLTASKPRPRPPSTMGKHSRCPASAVATIVIVARGGRQ